MPALPYPRQDYAEFLLIRLGIALSLGTVAAWASRCVTPRGTPCMTREIVVRDWSNLSWGFHDVRYLQE
jgi:hypothetical protein